MASSLTRRASCPSPWLSLVCKIPIALLGLLATNTIGYYTDYWGAYTRHLDPEEHTPGKRNTQKIERKHLTLRTRLKRLARKTLCFSRSRVMHDLLIRLYMNQVEFGCTV